MRSRPICACATSAVLLIAVGVFQVGAFAEQGTGSEASSREEKADRVAFEGVCGTCHPTSMAGDIRTESEWVETVEEMVKIGAKGSDEQFDRLMRFLLRTRTKVNVNNATAPEIAPVLDVSEATAQAIVKRRLETGGFKTLAELKKIPGVDAAKLDARKDRVVF
jgi:competence protein ComEA